VHVYAAEPWPTSGRSYQTLNIRQKRRLGDTWRCRCLGMTGLPHENYVPVFGVRLQVPPILENGSQLATRSVSRAHGFMHAMRCYREPFYIRSRSHWRLSRCSAAPSFASSTVYLDRCTQWARSAGLDGDGDTVLGGNGAEQRLLNRLPRRCTWCVAFSRRSPAMLTFLTLRPWDPSRSLSSRMACERCFRRCERARGAAVLAATSSPPCWLYELCSSRKLPIHALTNIRLTSCSHCSTSRRVVRL
jgi:hypothetical protein